MDYTPPVTPHSRGRVGVGLLFLLLVIAVWQPITADSKADLSQFVVVGDSLAAGFQNFSLLDTQQVHGAASLIARQARVLLDLPLVPYPGIPRVLTLVSPGPPPIVAQVPDPPPVVPRTNPLVQPTNLAVPGHTVHDAIATRPGLAADALTNAVLGFPTPFVVPGVPRSQMEAAVALSPTFILLWIGNNDTLSAAITGDLTQLTPPGSFAASYGLLSSTLASTGATMVMVNVPDVTLAPYFTSVEKFAAQVGLPVAVLGPALGVQSGDYLRPSALSIALSILSGQIPGPLPFLCPSILPDVTPAIACVLRGTEAAIIRAAVQAYNQAIAAAAAQHDAALVDLAALVGEIAENSVRVGGRPLTTEYLGGLYSLDGLHPTNTGYAIIANEILEQMKRQLHINIPKVNLVEVAADER